MLGFEFTGAPTRYYPMETERNRDAERPLPGLSSASRWRPRAIFAGRLANYVYIDMDDCMRQALDAAEERGAARAARRRLGVVLG